MIPDAYRAQLMAQLLLADQLAGEADARVTAIEGQLQEARRGRDAAFARLAGMRGQLDLLAQLQPPPAPEPAPEA